MPVKPAGRGLGRGSLHPDVSVEDVDEKPSRPAAKASSLTFPPECPDEAGTSSRRSSRTIAPKPVSNIEPKNVIYFCLVL